MNRLEQFSGDEPDDPLKQSADETISAIRKALTRPGYAVLDESGNVVECNMMTWARTLSVGGQRIIAQEDLPGGYWISTVFLGLDHSWNGPPLWFETMIFEPGTGEICPITGRVNTHGNDIFMDRYSTLKEALQGHEAAKRWFYRERS